MNLATRDTIRRVAPRLPWFTLVGTMAAAAVYLIPAARESLCYELDQPHSWWRGLTCHWVHWNGEHLFWSAAAFALLGGLCEVRSRASALMCVVACCAAIPLVIRLAPPSFSAYGGLSGIDFGLYMLLGAKLLREAAQERYWPRGLLAALLILMGAGKVVFELATGQVLFVTDMADLVPAPLAHATAGTVGLLCAGLAPSVAQALRSEARATFMHQQRGRPFAR